MPGGVRPLTASRMRMLRRVIGLVAALLAASGSSACRHQPAPPAIWVSAYLRAVDFGSFVDELHARLAQKGLLLTAAPGPTSLEAGFYAARQSEFDQINVQTYNLSGVSTKETWH